MEPERTLVTSGCIPNDQHSIRPGAVQAAHSQRPRIISEPASDYIRFEYEVTPAANLAAGEQVRWLPRQMASDLALPGNDFWLFDGAAVLFNYSPASRQIAPHPERNAYVVAKTNIGICHFFRWVRCAAVSRLAGGTREVSASYG